MRTTIDIPEDVLRRAKSEAALRGMKLKDYVAEALRATLRGDLALVRERAPEYPQAETQRISDECSFPVIRGPAGPAMRDLTPERLHEIDENEETARAERGADSR